MGSETNPIGLRPNQISWLVNGTVRGGSISPRAGYEKLIAFAVGIGILQEAQFYTPDFGLPYLIIQIAGRTFKYEIDSQTITEITIPGDANSATIDQSWMCQAECFMIIQDGVAVPLVWDGTTLRRVTVMSNANPKIPTATCMDYYQGRLWLAKGREVLGSDIVKGPSGTGTLGAELPDYGKRDSILSVKENTFEATGGVFTMPSQSGNIRALSHSANQNTALGEGILFAFTRRTIYSINVVTTRAEWITQEQPVITIASIAYGCISDRSIVKANGDLFFNSGQNVMSLSQAVRNFQQWANTPIDAEMVRLTQFNDKSLLRFASGIDFENRSYQTMLPYATDCGTAFSAIGVLDFDPLGTLAEKLPPAWEGANEGLAYLRLLSADFAGRLRAFSLVRSTDTGGIEIWELTDAALRDTEDRRISMSIESPSHEFGSSFTLKELQGCELWIDNLSGVVDFELQYREGRQSCWRDWFKFQQCAPRNNCELIGAPVPCDYPTQQFSQQYRAILTMPKPPFKCDETNKRPSNISTCFQIRLTTKGNFRLRGYLLWATERDRAPYEDILC